MKLPNNFGIGIGQVFQQSLDFFAILNSLGLGRSKLRAVDAGTAVLTASLDEATMAHFADDNAS